MAEYTIKLLDKKTVADGTNAFFFEKPADFIFKAGQFFELTHINPPENDEEGPRREFSIASSPTEPRFMMATRMRDTAFKRVLGKMSLGGEIHMEGPFGSFTLHQNASRPAVFLAGGIGITPFRSVILNAFESDLPHELYLFYSNRRPEDSAFLDELLELAKEFQNFTCVATMTEMEKSAEAWQGERGYITGEMISKYVQGVNNPIYYIAGPPAMVGAMKTMLEQIGISPDDIRFEEFTGY